ncbi:MAG: hypothetical protein ACK5OB_16540 [Pirellula sp.]
MKRSHWLGWLAGIGMLVGSVAPAQAGCWWRCHRGIGCGPIACYRPYYAPAVYPVGYYSAYSYRAYYAFPTGCWPSYSYYSAPVVVAPPVYYTPIYYTPVPCAPIAAPSFSLYDSFSESSTPATPPSLSNWRARTQAFSIDRNATAPRVSNPTPLFSGAPTRSNLQTAAVNPTQFASTRWAANTHTANSTTANLTSASDSARYRTDAFRMTRDAQRSVQLANPGSKYVSKSDTPAPIQPYSPVWTQSAVGLIDNLMDRGDWEIAFASCQRMEKVPSAQTHPVLLRQAIFELAAHRDAMNPSTLERILDKLNTAVTDGSQLSPSELRNGGLAQYLAPSGISLTDVMDQLSKQALEKPESSVEELLLLASLLTLDDQPERAELFAKEARAQAPLTDAFRWQSLLRTLAPNDIVVAASR